MVAQSEAGSTARLGVAGLGLARQGVARQGVGISFWSQPTTGVEYVRCTLPARALGGQVLVLERECKGHFTPETAFRNQQGVGVWQLVANNARLHAMQDCRRVSGQPQWMEVDDDYIHFHRSYVRGNWVEGDIPEDADWFDTAVTSSVKIHRQAVEEADGVIVSTPWLKKVYGEYNDNVHVCRNSVDPADWPVRPPDDDIFRVVFSGSPNMRDLLLIQRAMEWAAKQPGVEAWMVGFNPRWKGVKAISWIPTLKEFWRRSVELRPDLQLRPIETTAFSRSKSDLKILEAAMCGALPVVTAFEPYLGWRDTPVRFALTAKDWEQEVKRAVKDKERVKEDAARVREIVLAERTNDKVADDWKKALPL